jgi:hypothetical protein
MKAFLFGLISLVVCSPVVADVMLVVKDARGQTSKISSNGKQARIESAQTPGYAIVDYSKGELLAVDPQRQEIVRMSLGSEGEGSGEATLDVSLKRKGDGPKIAGYATRKFKVTANGEKCGTVFASKKLLENGGIQAMFESMRAMQKMVGGMSARFSGSMPVCQRANLALADTMDSNGAPMKVVDASGKLVSEVVSVDTSASFPGGHYQVPAGMKIVSMEQMMNQATQQMQGIPDMNQLLQESGGQMTPEMKQQMEQLQKMMEQMQQQ